MSYALPGAWVFVELRSPEGIQMHALYRSTSEHEQSAAQEAFDRVTPDESLGWSVHAAHVFREPPVTFWAKRQPRIVATTEHVRS